MGFWDCLTPQGTHAEKGGIAECQTVTGVEAGNLPSVMG